MHAMRKCYTELSICMQCQQLGGWIIHLLKESGPLLIEDRNFRHLIKRRGFQLLDLPEAGIRDAFVVQVKGGKEVIRSVIVFILLLLITAGLLVYRTLMTARS